MYHFEHTNHNILLIFLFQNLDKTFTIFLKYKETPFHNNRINVLQSWLENLYVLKNRFFNFLSNLC